MLKAPWKYLSDFVNITVKKNIAIEGFKVVIHTYNSNLIKVS